MNRRNTGGGKYKKQYATDILKLAEKYPMVEIAIKWGTTRVALERWAKNEANPEFTEAYARAKEINFATFMRRGLDNLENPRFNSNMWQKLWHVYYMNECNARVNLKNFAKAKMGAKMKIVLEAYEKGDIKTSELKEIMETMRIIYDIKQGAKIEERLAEMEKKIK